MLPLKSPHLFKFQQNSQTPCGAPAVIFLLTLLYHSQVSQPGDKNLENLEIPKI
jgi:hypothetical protein